MIMQSTFDDILVHVRDYKTRTPAARFAVQLAKAHDAFLTGAYICPEHVYMAASYGLARITQAMLEDERRLVDAAVEAGPSFCRWAREQGVQQAGWTVAQASVAKALAQACTRHDLLVLDRIEEDRFASVVELSEIIMQTAAPCVIASADAEYPTGRSLRAVVAWNGSPEAMRAVYSALPLLQNADVLLLRGEERDVNPRIDWHPSLDIRKYLSHHGVRVEEGATDAGRTGAGKALLRAAATWGADLLVMGAYGRTRFSEWVLGGVTRTMLEHAPLPVLVQH